MKKPSIIALSLLVSSLALNAQQVKADDYGETLLAISAVGTSMIAGIAATGVGGTLLIAGGTGVVKVVGVASVAYVAAVLIGNEAAPGSKSQHILLSPYISTTENQLQRRAQVENIIMNQAAEDAVTLEATGELTPFFANYCDSVRAEYSKQKNAQPVDSLPSNESIANVALTVAGRF